MRTQPLVYVLIVAAMIGLWFSSVSTYDFVAHLDRQVHGIHCSFLPGLSAPTVDSGGCQVTLMSPYSSVFRSSLWGGIPISLPAMSVFAFLLFWSISLVLRDRTSDARALGFTVLATALPFGMTLIMGYLSLSVLDAACKQCIGIYIASTLAFVAALVMWLSARSSSALSTGDTSWPALGVAFGIGVLFVAVPLGAYAASAPDFSKYVGACGQLDAPDDSRGVLVPLGPPRGASTMIEVLDPLCPSCKGFEERFAKMDVASEITRKALLFPLDDSCNWMVTDAIHPGACAISEAMLCAGDQAEEVLHWAFSQQQEIMAASRTDAKAAARLAGERFPALARCIGSPSVRAKLNLALRFAVKNRLSVLTPQVYVDGVRLCDEDTDLGLEFALPRLIERAKTMPKPVALPEPPPAPAPPVPAPAARRPTPAEAAPAPAAELPPSEPAQANEPEAPTDDGEPPPEAPPAPPEPAEAPAEADQPAEAVP